MVSSSDNKGLVILDTNILIYSASKPFNLESEMRRVGFSRVAVPSFVLDELISIGRSFDKRGKFARLALQIAKHFEIIRSDLEGADVDEKILRLAKEMGCAVATADAALRRRLSSEGVQVLLLKGRMIIDPSG
ncbi:MAG: PIN domain-containing protein [Candidatus Methanosuratincola sp.]